MSFFMRRIRESKYTHYNENGNLTWWYVNAVVIGVSLFLLFSGLGLIGYCIGRAL